MLKFVQNQFRLKLGKPVVGRRKRKKKERRPKAAAGKQPRPVKTLDPPQQVLRKLTNIKKTSSTLLQNKVSET